MPDGVAGPRDLSRLLAPRSIAVVGGGAWCCSIIEAARRIGYSGSIVPVHPKGKEIAGLRALTDLSQHDGPIDAAFIGVNRQATIEVVSQLRSLDAGGAICFASGFSEAQAEASDGLDLQGALVSAAGTMPILGPNCYGFVNALDRVAVWPDQHGMTAVPRGVAILTQSSNIAINLTMQRRSLPLGYMITCGNSAQTSQAALARHLLQDARVTALGLHIEGFGDLREWEALAQAARARGIPILALKMGRSAQAQAATTSHTASLAGGDAGAQAFLDRLGISRVHDLPSFVEALKFLHLEGRVAGPRIAAISCSGGEASLIADMAEDTGLSFPALTSDQHQSLRATLGPMVALSNPLDYHTHVWRDPAAMARAWTGLVAGPVDAAVCIVDYPHTDAVDWACATEAALAVRASIDKPLIVAATLPELMPLEVAQRLMAGGVLPCAGLLEALQAIEAALPLPALDPRPVLRGAAPASPGVLLSEAEAKAQLASVGIAVPRGGVAQNRAELTQLADRLTGPLVLKRLGLAHKSEAGAVQLGLAASDLDQAARQMGGDRFLLEEMVADPVAEVLVGVVHDPAHGFVLTLAPGGVLTELIAQSRSLLIPARREDLASALRDLSIWPLLQGYRGKPAAKIDALLDAVMALQGYVIHHAQHLQELEVNPLICTPVAAVAADAVLRTTEQDYP